MKTPMVITSQNNLMSENNEYKTIGTRPYITVKEKNKEREDEIKIKFKKRINIRNSKDIINSQSSKRSNDELLIINRNKVNNYITKYNNKKNRLENNSLYKNKTLDCNKKITDEEIINNNDKETFENKNDIYKEKEKDIYIDDIFNLIIGYDINQKIKLNDLKLFFFNSIPEGKTLNTNINKIKKDNNQNINEFKSINFNYNLEILRNNKIYFFAKIIKSFPYFNIKIYIKIADDEYIKIGKIVSNSLKNNFIVYLGDNKSNYKKIVNINYALNFFGFKVRNMTVEKIENNKVSYVLCNDSPEWDYEYKTYKLNFNGRVKKSCKKNFILKFKDSNNKNEENEKILQCGKIDDNSFALDFIYPLSPFEAFSLSLSSIVYKFSCE